MYGTIQMSHQEQKVGVHPEGTHRAGDISGIFEKFSKIWPILAKKKMLLSVNYRLKAYEAVDFSHRTMLSIE